MSGSSIPTRAIDALPAADTLSGAELLPLQKSIEGVFRTRRASIAAIVASVPPREHAHNAEDIDGLAPIVAEAIDAYLPQPLVLAAPTALTTAEHLNRTIYLAPGAAISLDWADTGSGFSALVLNRAGRDVLVDLAGFTAPIVNRLGAAAIAEDGSAMVFCVSPDAGVTRECWLLGDVAL